MTGQVTARYAILVSEFKLTLPQIRELTPRQINSIYFHARDKDGAVQAPSSSGNLHQLLGMIHAGLVKATPEQIAKLEGLINGSTRPNSE